jgi:hypothetical protein
VVGVAAAAIVFFGIAQPPTDTPVIRGAVEQADREGIASIAVVGPRDGAVVELDDLELVWQPIDGRPLYRVTVTDSDGSPVFTTTTEQTRSAIPNVAQLEVGSSYFWYVDAIQEDGRSASTGVRRFTVES